MKILFTGTSSFTGYWFVKELKENNHEIFATFTKNKPEDYENIRYERVKKSIKLCTPLWNCKFGIEKFIDIIKKEKFDILCNHAADVSNYKSPDFDYSRSVKNNTYNIKNVFEVLDKAKCNTVIVTGSVFEQNEGCGSKPLRAFSPYGLSKGLTYEIFKFHAQKYNIKLGKFLIPNPFGPFEESRFTAYLIKKWINNEIPTVRTPKYIRDNIHVSLLAKFYVYFTEKVYNDNIEFQKINPSGYVGSQGDFTKRFANEIRERTNLECKFELNDQTEFPEPEIRINTDMSERICPEWNEKKAWDDLLKYYEGIYC